MKVKNCQPKRWILKHCSRKQHQYLLPLKSTSSDKADSATHFFCYLPLPLRLICVGGIKADRRRNLHHESKEVALVLVVARWRSY